MATADPDLAKQRAAEAALAWVPQGQILGIGTGSTVNHFIAALADLRGRITGTVASSEASAERLRALQIPVFDLNEVDGVALYVDGADECDRQLRLIKGGGGALTREKIIAAVADTFVCIADDSKLVDQLGAFPLPVEVIPMARKHVAGQLHRLGGQPVWREGFVTDNGNVILDVHGLPLDDPAAMEARINNIVGTVSNGLFAARGADHLLLGSSDGVVEVPAPTLVTNPSIGKNS